MSLPKLQQVPGLHPQSVPQPDVALHARPATSTVTGSWLELASRVGGAKSGWRRAAAEGAWPGKRAYEDWAEKGSRAGGWPRWGLDEGRTWLVADGTSHSLQTSLDPGSGGLPFSNGQDQGGSLWWVGRGY
jgi:hypothetical protein